MLCREVQHYLAARKAAHTKPRNGSTDVDMDELTMRLYCARAGRKDSNLQDVYALPFMYVDAANFLCEHPKFGERTEAEEKQMRDSAMGHGESWDGGETSGMTVTGKRPRGCEGREARCTKTEWREGSCGYITRNTSRVEQKHRGHESCCKGVGKEQTTRQKYHAIAGAATLVRCIRRCVEKGDGRCCYCIVC